MKFSTIFSIIILIATTHPLVAGWTRTYGGEYSDLGMCVQATADGGYVVAGYTYPDSGPDMWIFKTDSSGNIQWSKIYGADGSELANSIVQTGDGGYAVIGKKEGHCWLLKLDGKGDTIWTKSYETEYGSEGYWLEETTDGGYIIAGTMWLPDTTGCGRSSAWLLKTDSLGDTLWTRACGYTEVNKAYGVCLAPDGGYVVTGVLDSKICGGGYAWWCKFDSLGQEVWSYDYNIGSEGYICYSNSVRPTADKGYIMAGPGWSLETDSLGKSQWMNVDLSAQDYSALETPTGSFIFAGSDGGIFTLRQRHSDGNQDWIKYYGSGTCYCIQKALDGGYIAVGYREIDYNCDLFLIKTDPNGDTLGITEPATPVTPVTPPISSEMEIIHSIGLEITLRYSNCADGFRAQVFDASGRKVDEIRSDETEGTIRCEAGLEPGVYFIIASGDSRKVSKVILLK